MIKWEHTQHIIVSEGPWFNGYQWMQIPRPEFNSQPVSRLRMLNLGKLVDLNHSLNDGFFLD